MLELDGDIDLDDNQPSLEHESQEHESIEQFNDQ